MPTGGIITQIITLNNFISLQTYYLQQVQCPHPSRYYHMVTGWWHMVTGWWQSWKWSMRQENFSLQNQLWIFNKAIIANEKHIIFWLHAADHLWWITKCGPTHVHWCMSYPKSVDSECCFMIILNRLFNKIL